MKKTNDFIVGAVVLGAAVSLVAATMWVQQTSLGRERAHVEVRFRDVGNAQVGSAVVIRGVQSGRIAAIELTDEGWVRLRMRLDEEVTLPRDPVVLLSSANLFGEWQATITTRGALPENADVRRQVAEASGEPGTLPGAMIPDIAQLTAVAGGIAGDVASVAERFKLAFDEDAAKHLRGTITNVARVSGELERTVRRQSGNIDSIAIDVGNGMEELRHTAATVRLLASRFDSATATGEVYRVMRDIERAAGRLDSAAMAVHRLSGRLGSSQLALDRVLARADSLLVTAGNRSGSLGLLLNDPTLYRRTDSLVTQLQSLLADFRQNPRRYVNLSIF
jgi:phospholipid/cholesterol/gamma-HCH transport system substrate-binding protein